MNIEHLRKLDELFDHRNDALVLLCLVRGVADAGGDALHFRQWVKALINHAGAYASENAITRSLPRLRERGLVIAYDEGTRHPSYRPSRLGAEKAALLAFILDALENRHSEAQDCRSTSDDRGEPHDADDRS